MSGKHNIILCEDEMIISLDLKRILENFGYNVAVVYKSAAEVLSYLQKDKPALVIADINLKGAMSGIELAEILVKEYSVKVLFLTGSPIHIHAQKVTELGCNFIMKPFDEDLLRKKLNDVFSEASKSK